MIINGDWSWTDYSEGQDIDAAVAALPIVSETGLPMQSMIAPKGFSLNANATPEAAAAAMAFVRHMTSPAVQQRIVDRLRMMPTRRSVTIARSILRIRHTTYPSLNSKTAD